MPFIPFVPSFVLRHVPPGFCAAPLHYGGMFPCRRVIFIEADPDTILASTFIYTGQRQHAIRCYAVPYGELCDVFEARMESGWESNVCQLYSTGRCGSTLLSKLLDQANSIVSISEPDVFSYVRVCCAVLCCAVLCCAVLYAAIEIEIELCEDCESSFLFRKRNCRRTNRHTVCLLYLLQMFYMLTIGFVGLFYCCMIRGACHVIKVTFLLSKDANCFEGDDLPRLLRAITWSLYDFAVGADPTKSAVCLKYRAQVIALAPTLKKSIPEAKNLFLYREGIATIDSFCMAFLGSWGARTARWLNLDSLFISKLSGWVEIFDYLMPYVNKDGAPPKELYLGGGFPAFMTMIWLSNMDQAYELATAGFFDATIRYEDLCVHRLIVVNKLLEAVGMEEASLSGDADKVFDEDAHASSTGGLVGNRGASAEADAGAASSGAAMKKKPLYIPPSDLPALQTLIASHSELNSCNFVLPNTLKF